MSDTGNEFYCVDGPEAGKFVVIPTNLDSFRMLRDPSTLDWDVYTRYDILVVQPVYMRRIVYAVNKESVDNLVRLLNGKVE